MVWIIAIMAPLIAAIVPIIVAMVICSMQSTTLQCAA